MEQNKVTIYTWFRLRKKFTLNHFSDTSWQKSGLPVAMQLSFP
jgi:hypothetical protein